MSFDIKLVDGDLKLKTDGTLELVANDSKLKQDILKAIFTPTGSHKLHTWYGSPLLSQIIGKALDKNIRDLIIKNGIFYALNNLITLQDAQQNDGQYLSPKEELDSINDVFVEHDPVDPRKLNIFITVTTRSGSIISDEFTINL